MQYSKVAVADSVFTILINILTFRQSIWKSPLNNRYFSSLNTYIAHTPSRTRILETI